MKTILIFLIAIVFSGCDDIKKLNKEPYSTIAIEGCEYIEVSYCLGTTVSYYSLTHKGNCKYCKSRQLPLLKYYSGDKSVYIPTLESK